MNFEDIVRGAVSTDLQAGYYSRKHKQPAYDQSHRHNYKAIKGHPRADDTDSLNEPENASNASSASDEDLKPKSDRQKSPKAGKKNESKVDEDEIVDEVTSKTPTTSNTHAQVHYFIL